MCLCLSARAQQTKPKKKIIYRDIRYGAHVCVFFSVVFLLLWLTGIYPWEIRTKTRAQSSTKQPTVFFPIIIVCVCHVEQKGAL